jgi:hypothetical protein
MRSTGLAALVATVVSGLIVLALVAERDDRELAFTIGVVPSIPAAELKSGETVCQSPISVPQDFDRVRLQAGAPGSLGQPLTVSVLSADGGRRLGRGRVPGGYFGPAEPATTVGEIAAGQKISVCVRNAGARKIALYGNAAGAAPPSEAIRKGRALDTDITLVFLHREPQSMLSLLPEIFERASLFRPGWVGPWLFWALTAAAFLGVPLLLARALALSGDEL